MIILLPLLSLMVIPLAVEAATITICTFDKDTYNQGQTGYITVTIHNDKEAKIKITELTATVDYYYTDGNVYLQPFFTNATLPTEIQKGQSDTFYIPFSLPTNIAPGYTELYVKAKTEIWIVQEQTWLWSEHPTYQPTLHIESPYKQQLEEQQTINEQLEKQLEEQQTTNKNATTMMYLFGATTVVFAAVTVFLFSVNRRARVFTQPIA